MDIHPKGGVRTFCWTTFCWREEALSKARINSFRRGETGDKGGNIAGGIGTGEEDGLPGHHFEVHAVE